MTFRPTDRELVRGVRIPGEHQLVDVEFVGGKIRRIVDAKRDRGSSAESSLDGGGDWLLPGWIDLQVNDVAWVAGGLRDPEEHAARVREICRLQAETGVTGLALATLAAPIDEIIAYLRGLALVCSNPTDPAERILLGGLVEGSFMNPEFCGAHNPKWIVPPALDVLDEFLATNAVRLINVAPEMSDAAMAVIRRATAAGVVVGVGHAKPHAECLREAISAGARYVIHLGNGPTGSSLKGFHDGGMLEESLRNDALVVTVIVDGYHVHFDLVRDWIERKEPERFVAVSDAAFAMDFPAGEFEVFGVGGVVSPDGRYLQVAADSAPKNPRSSDVGRLFGAAAQMRDVFENLLNLVTTERAGVYYRRHRALELADGIALASQVCSASPAALLGMNDRGVVREGARADAILVSVGGAPGSYSVRVRDVWIGV